MRTPARGLLVLFLSFSGTLALGKRCEAEHSPIALAALSTVKTFLSGIAAHNASTMLATIIPSGSAVLSRGLTVLYLNLTAVVERIPFSDPQEFEERIVGDVVVRVDDDVAVVWAPYEFHIDGAVDHVGSNIFSLLEREGVWKISGVADTSRKPGVGCE